MATVLRRLIVWSCLMTALVRPAFCAWPPVPINALQFTHVGPQAAAFPYFLVTAGQGDSAGLELFILPETYTRIIALAEKLHGGTTTPAAPGTFELTLFEEGKPKRSWMLRPAAMLVIINRVSGMFEGMQQKPPDLLVKLERMF